MALIKDSIEISSFFLAVRPLKPIFLSNNLRKSETTKTKAKKTKTIRKPNVSNSEIAKKISLKFTSKLWFLSDKQFYSGFIADENMYFKRFEKHANLE